jgi:hypothetical protein
MSIQVRWHLIENCEPRLQESQNSVGLAIARRVPTFSAAVRREGEAVEETTFVCRLHFGATHGRSCVDIA